VDLGKCGRSFFAGHEIWKSINIQIVFLSLCKIHDYTLFYERSATVLIFQKTQKSQHFQAYLWEAFFKLILKKCF